MKLFIILLSLLSERYLPHVLALHRFTWFENWFTYVGSLIKIKNQTLHIVLSLLPIVFLLALLLAVVENMLFGIIAFVLHLVIFYYCLGPQNPFYPIRELDQESLDPDFAARRYLFEVNSQLFAPIFWFILGGPLVLVVYRLSTLIQKQDNTRNEGEKLVNVFDWLTVRLTLLLYLFAGNFQKGFGFFSQNWLSKPDKNEVFLSQGGLLCAQEKEQVEPIRLTAAQNLVERALIIFLVFIAVFILAACL